MNSLPVPTFLRCFSPLLRGLLLLGLLGAFQACSDGTNDPVDEISEDGDLEASESENETEDAAPEDGDADENWDESDGDSTEEDTQDGDSDVNELENDDSEKEDSDGDDQPDGDTEDTELDAEWEAEREWNMACRDAGLDAYFGSLCYETEATGFFRVENIDGVWWFITPSGHPFFSMGVNGINFSGTATADGVQHYADTCTERYGNRETWADAQMERFDAWGINTAGGWSEWGLYKNRLPFTVTLGLAGSDWLTGTVVDYFHPDWEPAVRARLEAGTAGNTENPYLIGYFLDNELHWSHDHRGGDLLSGYMAMSADSAGKTHLLAFLLERYGTIASLNVDFSTNAASWEELAGKTKLTPRRDEDYHPLPDTLETISQWTKIVAERYFSVTNTLLKELDPNHLNLGVRFVSQLCAKEAVAAAGRHVDVMTINFYDLDTVGNTSIAELTRSLDDQHLPLDNYLEAMYRVGGKPILMTEWGFRARDAGLPNSYPPIYPILETQQDRADAFGNKMREILARPWFIGQHWFQYVDQPPEGRFDGEDNNFGLLSEGDEPYTPLTDRWTEIAQDLYVRLPVSER